MWDDLFFCPPAQGAEGDIPHASKHPPVTSRKIRKAWLVKGELSHVFIYIKCINMGFENIFKAL